VPALVDVFDVDFVLCSQLQYGQDDNMKNKVDIVAILSMSDKEIRDALKIVSATCLLIYFTIYVSRCLLTVSHSRVKLNVIILSVCPSLAPS